MSRGTSGRETTLGEDSRETTHKSRRIVVTVLTMAAVVVVTAVGGAALVSGTVTVGDGETPAGETVTVPVTLSQAADGVAGFRVRLELPDDETAAFVAASVGSEFGLDDKFVTPTTLELEGSDVDDAVESPAGTVRLGTVTVRGVEPGTVPIDVTVEEADDDSGDPVSTTAAVGNVTVTQRTSPLTVVTPSPAARPVFLGGVGVDGETETTTITVRNDGDDTLDVTASLRGGSAFELLGASTRSIAPGETETLTVRFDPSTATRTSTRLVVTPESGDGPGDVPVSRSVLVAGGGRAPAVSVGREDVALGNLSRTASVEARTARVLVQNPGSDPLSVTPTVSGSGVSLIDPATGDPPASDTLTVSPGGSTVVGVLFDPSSDGDVSGTLTVETNASSDPTLPLSAEAVSPTVAVAASETDLGTVSTGSAALTDLTVSNDGAAPLSVTVTTTDDVTVTTPSGATPAPDGDTTTPDDETTLTIPAGQSRTLTSTLQVDSTGDVSGTVTLETNDPDSPTQTVDLTADGVESTLDIDTERITFGSVPRADSVTQTVDVTNDGDAPVDVGTVAVEGADAATFTVTDGLPSTLAPGESASVRLQFDPDTAGSYTASLVLGADDAVRRSLTGTAVGPDVSGPPAARAGVVAVGETGIVNVSLGNTGPSGTTLSVDETATSVVGSDSFSVRQLPSTLSSGESSRLVVAFEPSTRGDATGTLRVHTDDPETPVVDVTLTGIGAQPAATLSTQTVSYGVVDTGERAVESVTLTDTGGVPLTVTDVAVTGPDANAFELLDPPEERLVPGQSVDLRVAVTPETDATFDATLSVSYAELPDSTVDLSATGVEPTATLVSADTVSYGEVDTGSAATRTVTVRNDGAATLVVGTPTVVGGSTVDGESAAAYTVASGDSRATVPPGGTVEYTVAFAPTESLVGDSSLAQLRLPTPNDPDSDAITVALNGEAVPGTARLTPAAVSFGAVANGSTATETVTLRNRGDGSLDLTAVRLAGADADNFSVSSLALETLDAGDSVTLTVTAEPAVRGRLAARLVVETDDGSVTSSIGARGVEPVASVQTSALAFGETRLGEVSTGEIDVRNTGNVPLNVTDLTATADGTGDDLYTVVSGPSLVQPGETATVTVSFDPAAADTAVEDAREPVTRTGRVRVVTNDTTTIVSLSGVGVTPELTVSAKSLRYGTVSVGDTVTRSLTVRNGLNGSAPVAVTGWRVGGDNDDFTVTGLGDGVDLAPGEATTLTVAFEPSETGSSFGTLSVLTNDSRQGAALVGLSNTQTVVEVTFGSVTTTYKNPDGGVQPTVDISRNVNRDVSLETITTAASTTSDFAVTLDTSQTAFGTALGRSDFTALRYLDASTTGSFENATVEFGVRKAALAGQDVPRDSVRLLRDTGSGYTPVETTLVRETPRRVIFAATVDSTAPDFVIAGGAPDLGVVDSGLSRSTVQPGQTVDVLVTVANGGRAPGTRQVGVTRETDGQTETASVTVQPGERETARLTFTLGDTGRVGFAVPGVSDQTATVTRRGDGSGGSDDTGVVPPTAALSGPTTATVGASITLDASESTDNAGITSYEWDTDGDGTFERSTDSPTLTVAFEQPENRTVTVRTVDFAGATDTASLRLTVAADTPANQTQTPAGGSETTPAATTSTPTEPPQTATPPQTPTAAATPESPAPTAKTPATAQTPATRTTDAPSDRRTPAETATATPETERSRTTTGGTPETPPSTESRTQTQTQTPGFTAVLTLLALLLIVGRAAGRRRT